MVLHVCHMNAFRLLHTTVIYERADNLPTLVFLNKNSSKPLSKTDLLTNSPIFVILSKEKAPTFVSPYKVETKSQRGKDENNKIGRNLLQRLQLTEKKGL